MDNKEFFCPVYEGNITQYDCDEITCGLKMGYFINDGVPPLVPMATIKSKEHLCYACDRNPNKDSQKSQEPIKSITREKMSEDEIRKRLSGRAMEYLMFLDDDE